MWLGYTEKGREARREDISVNLRIVQHNTAHSSTQQGGAVSAIYAQNLTFCLNLKSYIEDKFYTQGLC